MLLLVHGTIPGIGPGQTLNFAFTAETFPIGPAWADQTITIRSAVWQCIALTAVMQAACHQTAIKLSRHHRQCVKPSNLPHSFLHTHTPAVPPRARFGD